MERWIWRDEYGEMKIWEESPFESLIESIVEPVWPIHLDPAAVFLCVRVGFPGNLSGSDESQSCLNLNRMENAICTVSDAINFILINMQSVLLPLIHFNLVWSVYLLTKEVSYSPAKHLSPQIKTDSSTSMETPKMFQRCSLNQLQSGSFEDHGGLIHHFPMRSKSFSILMDASL